MTEMQHSNSKLDNTHPKVDIWRNMESPGLNCVQNSSGFLVCVLIYTYMYMHLWSFGMSICRGTSQSKGDDLCFAAATLHYSKSDCKGDTS